MEVLKAPLLRQLECHQEVAPPEASRSLCRAYREAILTKFEEGLLGHGERFGLL